MTTCIDRHLRPCRTSRIQAPCADWSDYQVKMKTISLTWQPQQVPGNEGGDAALQAPSLAPAGGHLLKSPRTPGPSNLMITAMHAIDTVQKRFSSKKQSKLEHQERINRLVPGFQPYDHPSQKVFDIKQWESKTYCSIASSGCRRAAKQAFRAYWGCGMGWRKRLAISVREKES